MRVGIVIVIVLSGLFLSECTTSNQDCDPPANLRPKQREVRGFKPKYISTAIDFGKREVSKQNSYERIMLLLQNFPRRMAIHWIICEMKKNPVFAKKILRKIFRDEKRKKYYNC